MKTLMAVAMVCSLLLAVERAAAAPTPDVAVLPAEVRGAVVWPDARTPIADLKVRVWDAETEDVVFRTVTDNDGVFNVPKLTDTAGRYYVIVGPVRIDMSVLTARADVVPQAHGFVIVLPKRVPLMQPFVPTTVAGAVTALPEVVSQ